ncbi:hypothetical protein F5Y05DRAFT_412585 [Hypoxylon sp. FL0543]|nr:hypothetical protein F5Y05DRAFT_412585 [Hypoxylon sp. FL0543]
MADGNSTTSASAEGAGEAPMSAALPSEKQYTINDLFDAIQSRTPSGIDEMRKILTQNPELINMQNKPKDEITPQKSLEEKRLGNLMTQDVLRHLQGQHVVADAYGEQRPLHVACLFGNSEAVELLLLQDDIDLNATNVSDETPLGIACRAAKLSIATLLIRKSNELTDEGRKIHVAQQDDVGNTPIDYLACRGVYPVWNEDDEPSDDDLKGLIELMLEASKQDPTLQVSEQNPETRHKEFSRFCIAKAISLRSVRLLRILHEVAPASKDLPDQDGWTALHFAIYSGNTEAVEMLLENGAKTQLVTKYPKTSTAYDFALEFWRADIATMISQRQGFVADQPSYLEAWISPKEVIPRNKVDGNSGSRKLSIRDLIQKFDKIRQEVTQPESKQVIWCHFPANNWHWIKVPSSYPKECYGDRLNMKHINDGYHYQALYSAPPSNNPDQVILGCLEKAFGPFPSFRDPCFIIQKRDAMAAGDENPPGKKSQYDDDILVAVLPVIDIDLLDGFRGREGMGPDVQPSCDGDLMRLYNGKHPGLHRPRTLDHYYHDDLHDDQVGDLNETQVFTRYLRRSGHVRDVKRRSVENQPLVSNSGPAAPESSPIRSQGSPQQDDAYEQSPAVESQTSGKGHPERKDQPDDKGKPQTVRSSERILVVSQLWLIRANKILATLFPKRRSATYEDEGPQFPQEIQKMFKTAEDPNIVYHDMVWTSMQYQPSLEMDEKATTYLVVFSKETLRVSRAVDECYGQFKSSLGQSDFKFRSLSDKASTCLMNINDVLNEIEIIKKVSEQRASVWEDMHNQRDRRGPEATSRTCCTWGVKGCNPSKVTESSQREIDKIEKSAKVVQKKASDLMSLLHGQAGTENAIRSFEQARSLAIFTWLTVVFVSDPQQYRSSGVRSDIRAMETPLSFVTSLLALQIESFTPSRWAKGQVAAGCAQVVKSPRDQDESTNFARLKRAVVSAWKPAKQAG